MLVFGIVVTLMLFPIGALYDKLTPMLCEAAAIAAEAKISESVSRYAAGYDLGELVALECNESGIISNIRTDTSRINEIKADFTEKLTKELKRTTVKISVPIGDVIGTPETLGGGFELPVRITGYSAAVNEIKSEFASAGINQTIHQITMTVKIEYTIILPRMKTKNFTLITDIPLAETVIIGDVPNYYR